jgi:hypothetical protein
MVWICYGNFWYVLELKEVDLKLWKASKEKNSTNHRTLRDLDAIDMRVTREEGTISTRASTRVHCSRVRIYLYYFSMFYLDLVLFRYFDIFWAFLILLAQRLYSLVFKPKYGWLSFSLRIKLIALIFYYVQLIFQSWFKDIEASN